MSLTSTASLMSTSALVPTYSVELMRLLLWPSVMNNKPKWSKSWASTNWRVASGWGLWKSTVTSSAALAKSLLVPPIMKTLPLRYWSDNAVWNALLYTLDGNSVDQSWGALIPWALMALSLMGELASPVLARPVPFCGWSFRLEKSLSPFVITYPEPTLARSASYTTALHKKSLLKGASKNFVGNGMNVCGSNDGKLRNDPKVYFGAVAILNASGPSLVTLASVANLRMDCLNMVLIYGMLCLIVSFLVLVNVFMQ